MTTGIRPVETIRYTRGLLGQAAPGSGSDTDLYTVPEGYTFRGTLRIANRSTATTYRIALREDGDTLATVHYIAFDAAIGDNEPLVFPDLELDETDVVTVRGGSANLSFTLSGVEEPRS